MRTPCAAPATRPTGPTTPSERDSLQLSLEASIGAFTVLNFNQVSEIVSNEIVVSAAIAVVFASIAILAYISWTFRNVPKSYRYGIAALVAAGHDILFVIGAFSIFGKVFGTEVDSMFITGVLTVLGFSVHDTIVVFDRIRENVTTNPGVAYDEIVNASLTETLARSLKTSITVIFAILALLLLGAGQIRMSHNLKQRRAGSIQIDQRTVVGLASGKLMPQLARVFLQMRADDADAFGCAIGAGEMHYAVKTQRQIVLADLIPFGEVGIEVVFAIPLAELGDHAVDRQADHHRQLHRPFVHHRQRPRKRRDNRIDQRVGRSIVMIRMREVR